MENEKKEFTGIFIPKHIIEDEDLSMSEMIIYSEIACFEICYKSNERLGERWGLKPNTISIIISRLIDKGYIVSGSFDGRNRQLIALRDNPNQRQHLKKIKGRLLKKSKAGIEKNHTIDNSIDNSVDNSINLAKQSFAESEVVKEHSQEIQEIFNLFYEINPTINFGNKTQRKAAEELIHKFGVEKTMGTVKFAISIQGKRYAPTITNPLELKNNLAKLLSYHKREQEPVKGSAPIFKV